VTSIKAAQSSDDSTFNDLEGTGQSVADTDDNKCFAISVIQPSDRYVRCTADRGTQNAVIDSIIAIQFRAGQLPVTHDSTTVGGAESHLAPAEGTA
jgi:hypothetical protein